MINNEYKYKRERIYCPNSVRLVSPVLWHVKWEMVNLEKDGTIALWFR